MLPIARWYKAPKTVPVEPDAAQPALPAGNAGSATDSTSKAPIASESSPIVAGGEVKPEVYYIRNKEGRLVPVPGFSYEDFIRLYRLKEKIDLPAATPRFSLEQMTLTGTVRGGSGRIGRRVQGAIERNRLGSRAFAIEQVRVARTGGIQRKWRGILAIGSGGRGLCLLDSRRRSKRASIDAQRVGAAGENRGGKPA